MFGKNLNNLSLNQESENEILEESLKNKGFPSATELLAMPIEEREKWMALSFRLAEKEEFEIFDAYGEEKF